MIDASTVSIVVSVFALVVSFTTLWLTHFRKGRVLITRPAQIYIGADSDEKKSPKIFILALLYTDAQKGCVLEDLFVTIKRGEMRQTFPIWVHGSGSTLKRGGGLYVGKEGVSQAHHFLLPAKTTNFEFARGKYAISVSARAVGDLSPTELFFADLEVDETQAASLRNGGGLYFDWGPESQSYIPNLAESAEMNVRRMFLEQAGKKIEVK